LYLISEFIRCNTSEQGQTMTTTALSFTGRDALILVGKMANEYADVNIFNDFNGRKAENTLRAYRADLGSFATFLSEASKGAVTVTGDALQTTPDAWTGVTWGLVAAFARWLLAGGASTATVNRKLAAVKVYAGLAAEAGAIDGQDAAKIAKRVHGYTGKAARNVDRERTEAGTPTRQGAKKAAHVSLTADQVKALKTHPDTPQGRRDALLMCLLLDHGLRVGELALLTVDAFYTDESGVFAFYRPKVGKEQRHRLSVDTLRALTRYFEHDAPDRGALLFRQSAKGGQLKTGAGISERNLSERVRTIAKRIGIDNLSAHDCRHSWATRAVAAGTDAFALRDAGGWSSLAMPSRYVEAAAIANERVKL
jgi:integrase